MIDHRAHDTPTALAGLGLPINHDVSGRISVAVAEHVGLCNIRYNGRTISGNMIPWRDLEPANTFTC